MTTSTQRSTKPSDLIIDVIPSHRNDADYVVSLYDKNGNLLTTDDGAHEKIAANIEEILKRHLKVKL